MTHAESHNGHIVAQVAPDRVYAASTHEVEQWWRPVDGPAPEAGGIIPIPFAPHPTR